ncbi:Os01g0588950 [Oryza sativa Japonica Group]|uniref:Os01g0588950 protein n=1 Tax=Oryza sativa subsp. japonica TaxID=39947 RepID=A0A0P0V4N2_ORYSJ|nr:hypothetical protein DAI22_01g225400 [Oryza sativa Japonica Group]BAS72931.1 Os01g0588950 [Oryza sativa Japonica Group]
MKGLLALSEDGLLVLPVACSRTSATTARGYNYAAACTRTTNMRCSFTRPWMRTTRGYGCFIDISFLLAHVGIPFSDIVMFVAAAPPLLLLSYSARISHTCFLSVRSRM